MIFNFEVYGDEFEVIWDGGPLLPPRESKTSHVWETLPAPTYKERGVILHRPGKGYGRYRNSVEWRSKHDIPAHPTDEDNRGRGPLASVRSEQLSQPLQAEAERGGDGG